MTYDLIIIGSGPAGLSAAINAASEGLSTLIVDGSTTFGGQASQATLIENYPGFPDGISGEHLTKLFVTQAGKFGVDFISPFMVQTIKSEDGNWIVCSTDGDEVTGKSIILAIGVSYRHLNAKNLARYNGAGVYYRSPSVSEKYKNACVCIVGGANSSGQAAVHLSSAKNCDVHLLVRGSSIGDKMSQYLVDKIAGTANIKVHLNTEVIAAKGWDELETITVRNLDGEVDIPTDKLFILIGAKPRTLWLKNIVPMDKDGYIRTGSDVVGCPEWMAYEENRMPLAYECVPGIFAVGDTMLSPTKRVAHAIGSGATCISSVHRYLSLNK